MGTPVAAGVDLIREQVLQCFPGCVGNYFQSGKSRNRFLARPARAAPLHRNAHYGFAPHPAPAAPAQAFAMFLAANIPLIDLHQAAQPVAGEAGRSNAWRAAWEGLAGSPRKLWRAYAAGCVRIRIRLGARSRQGSRASREITHANLDREECR